MDPLTVAVRSGLYLILMSLFGMGVFRVHALIGDPRERQFGNGMIIFMIALAGIALSALGLVALAASMSGTGLLATDPGAIALLLRETSMGQSGLVRLAALLFAALCGLIWRRHPLPTALGTTLTGAIALASLAWSGHGAMDDGTAGWIHLGADVVHLLAAGIWVGALLALLALAMRRRGGTAHLRRLHAALERFSAMGIAVVLLLFLTGFANSLFLVGEASLTAIVASRWSWLMAAKLALFAAMLLLAAINRFRLAPAISGARTAAALRPLRLSLLLETAAAIVILLLVAGLGLLEPPVSGL